MPPKFSASQDDRKKQLNGSLKWASLKQFVASIAGVILIVVQQQMVFFEGGDHPWPLRPPQDEIKESLNNVRWAISILTIASIMYLYKFYKAQLGILILKNILPADSTFFTSAVFFRFILEAFFLSIHPFPYVDSLPLKSPHIYLAFTLFPFARVIYAGRIVSFFSSLNSANGRFIGALTCVDFTSSFFLKATLRQNPLKCICCCWSVLLVFAGYSLYVTERLVCSYERSALGLNDPLACGGNELLSFWNAQWILIITISTIGYGDVYPYTHGGRFVAVLAGFAGMIIIALAITFTNGSLSLNRSESKMVSFLKKNSNNKNVWNQAARSVQAAYRLYLARKKPEVAKKTHPQKKLKDIRELRHHLFQMLYDFRCTKRYAVSNDGLEPIDKQTISLETMEVNVDEMKDKIKMLFDYHQSSFEGRKGGYIYSTYCFCHYYQLIPLNFNSKAQDGLCKSSTEKLGAESSAPRWATPLQVTFARIIAEIAGLRAFPISHRSYVFLAQARAQEDLNPNLFSLQ